MESYSYSIDDLHTSIKEKNTAPADLARSFKNRIYQGILTKRGDKYKKLRALRLFKYAACDFRRGEFFETYYSVMRYLDDVADGDVAPPVGQDAGQYIRDKQHVLFSEGQQEDAVDILLKYCIRLGEAFGENFYQETDDLLESLIFDAERRGKHVILPEHELMEHYYMLDIRGTIQATLKVFNEKPEHYEDLKPIGTATRIYYDLRDLAEDTRAGFINIPQEEIEYFEIDWQKIGTHSKPEKMWMRHKAQEGMRLLDEHRTILPKMGLRKLTNFTLSNVYEKPARKLFQQIRSEAV